MCAEVKGLANTVILQFVHFTVSFHQWMFSHISWFRFSQQSFDVLLF